VWPKRFLSPWYIRRKPCTYLGLRINIVSQWIEACFHLPTDEILTYGYVKPRDLWFPTEEGPSVDPLGSPGGSGGYTYQVRLRAPLD
jgi:hypothetical protein